MIVTEKDASIKLCHKRLNEFCKCYGSQCMAWRWHDNEYETKFNKKIPDGEDWELITYQSGSHWRRPRADRRRGYCGLAYPPEEI